MVLDDVYRFPEDLPGQREEPVRAQAPVLLCSVDMDTTCSVLRLRGELDVESAALLGAVVDGQIVQEHLQLHLDLSGLTFCDLHGLDALAAAHERLQQVGGHLHVHGASDFLRRTAHLCGAGGLLGGPS